MQDVPDPNEHNTEQWRGASSSTHLGSAPGALQLGEHIQQVALVVHLQHQGAWFGVMFQLYACTCMLCACSFGWQLGLMLEQSNQQAR
jgi:hypothetical protein